MRLQSPLEVVRIKHYRYQQQTYTSDKRPTVTHMFFEYSTFTIMPDFTDATKLLISDDGCDTWNSVNTGDFTNGVITRAKNIVCAWHDRDNDKIYFGDTTPGDDITIWYLDLSDFTVNVVGADIGDATYFVYDVWIRDSKLEVLAGDNTNDNFEIFEWQDPNWVSIDTINSPAALQDHDASNGIIIGTLAYFWTENVASTEVQMNSYNGAAITELAETTGGNTATDSRDRSNIYHDSDNGELFYIADSGAGIDVFYSYNITGDSVANITSTFANFRNSRHTQGGVPYEPLLFERGKIIHYSLPFYNKIIISQDLTDFTLGANGIVSLSDNYCLAETSGADFHVFKNQDVSSLIADINYNGGIIPTVKTGTFKIHPGHASIWNKKESIKIYDDNDVLEVWAKLTDKTTDARGLIHYPFDFYSNEMYRVPYTNTYSADDTDAKQKDMVDNAFSFNYRSASIVATTITWSYAYARVPSYLFNLARFLERQVGSIDPDGKVITEAYNGLTATGKSWTLGDGNQKVKLINIPGIEEEEAGYYDGSLGVTRVPVRYKNDTAIIRPVAATRDPLEDVSGIIPLKEQRDPKMEAATEANQWGDNCYNIFSADIQFIGLLIEGQGFLPEGQTIQVKADQQVTIAQANFLIVSYRRDPKRDLTTMILSDNIVHPHEYTSYLDTTNIQIQAANLQTFENQADIARDIQCLKLIGRTGFTETDSFGSSIIVAFSDVNAQAVGSFYVEKGGSFKLMIFHKGSGANNGLTAGGDIYISYDVDGGTQSWDISAQTWDLALANANITNLDTFGTAFTVGDTSRVGCNWIKNDNAGGAAGNMTVQGFALVRQ